MGYNNSTQTQNATFFTLTNGKVRRRLAQKTEGSTERQLKDGSIVNELVHDEYEGVLINVSKQDSEWGMQWKFEFNDGGAVSVCNMNYDSATAQKFINLVLSPEVKLSQAIKLKPYDFVNDAGKRMSGVTVYQDGAKILPAYGTLAYPIIGRGNMPELALVKYKGKDSWDSTDRLAFLDGKISEQFATKTVTQVQSIAAAPEPDSLEDLFS